MTAKKRRVILAVACFLAALLLLLVLTVGKRDMDSSVATGRSPQHERPTRPGTDREQLPTWFAKEAASARRIAGHVVHDGERVPGVRVSLHTMLSKANRTKAVSTVTNKDGAFDFGERAAAFYWIAAEAPDGMTSTVLRLNLDDPTLRPAPDQLVLKLQGCSAAVSGTILDASGNPLPAVDVHRDGLTGGSSDAHGKYRLCLPLGDSEVEFSADGYGAVTLTISALGEVERDVILVPEATVRIEVVRDDDATAVSDAHVSLYAADWGTDRPAIRTAMTDSRGLAHVGGLVPGRYYVNGIADGLQSEQHAEVLAVVGAESSTVLRLAARARIAGIVMDGDRPVAGARVSAHRPSSSARSLPSISQEDGTFVLESVPLGEVTFLAPPHKVLAPTSFEVTEAKEYSAVVVDVQDLGILNGIVSRQGNPVEGATICCVATISDPTTRVVTGGDGRYEVRGVVPGTYKVGAHSDDIGAFTVGSEVRFDGAETRTVDLELESAASISGTVVDGGGRPVKGAFVRWTHASTGDLGRCVSDAKGRYRCGAMTGGGKYQAAVLPSSTAKRAFDSAGGEAYPVVELRDGGSAVEDVILAIDLPNLTISGRVVDRDGAPVVDAVVRAELLVSSVSPAFSRWAALPLTATDEDGTFVLRGLQRADFALQARTADGGEGTASPIAAGSKAVAIRVERAARIEGQLEGFADTPEVNARLVGTSEFVTASVAGEAFTVRGLRAGSYVVSAHAAGEGAATIVAVRSDEVAKTTLTAQGSGRLTVNVLDFRSRTPIANVACHVVMSAEGQMSIAGWSLATAPRTNAQGRLVFGSAPAGTVVVACAMPAPNWSWPSAAATLATDAAAELDLLSVELTSDSASFGLKFDESVPKAIVADVFAKSPASEAGARPSDVITAVNGSAVEGLNGLGVWNLIDSFPVGTDVILSLDRAGAEMQISAKMRARN